MQAKRTGILQLFEMHRIDKEEMDMLQNSCYLLDKSCYFMKPLSLNSDKKNDLECPEGNLSWLLNYKIHELPPVPDTSAENENSSYDSSYTIQLDNEAINEAVSNSVPLNSESILRTHNFIEHEILNDKQQHYVCTELKKPPFTYTELIEYALSEKGELTVSGIYQWISEHFPFYKQNDDRWKNSVRHNLSINPHFRKGGKAIHGAGHLWTIAQKDTKKSWQIKQRMKQFMQNTSKTVEEEEEEFNIEIQAATASILETTNEFYVTGEDEDKGSREIHFLDVVEVENDLKEFLSPPVPKQQIVHECGLENNFVILDSNTTPLDLHEEEVIHDGNFYEDTTFEYYELEKQ